MDITFDCASYETDYSNEAHNGYLAYMRRTRMLRVIHGMWLMHIRHDLVMLMLTCACTHLLHALITGVMKRITGLAGDTVSVETHPSDTDNQLAIVRCSACTVPRLTPTCVARRSVV